MILQVASDQVVYSLDGWMCGMDEIRARLYEASTCADLILIEGVMGLFDGNPSNADLAAELGIALIGVIDASSMAESFAMLVHGMQTYRTGLRWHGVLANRVASARHEQLLRGALADKTPWLGALYRDSMAALPRRHLGLVQAQEIADIRTRLDRLGEQLGRLPIATALPELALNAPPLVAATSVAPLAKVRIAVARDAAFSFIYPANLHFLEELGASLCYFSPLVDEVIPQADSLYLPGGYPELYLKQLGENRAMRAAVRQFADSGRGIYAECGGMLYLLESLCYGGACVEMAGVLPGQGVLRSKLTGLGMQEMPMFGHSWRGHTFHHSEITTQMTPIAHAQRCDPRDERPGEPLYRQGAVLASYLHAYFPSSRALSVRVFGGS